MPELPEVERGRLVAEMVALGRTIRRARCSTDRIVFCDQTPATVTRRLKGRTVTAACRHGKQLWLEFDEGPALLLHFGMTGALHGYEHDADRPRFWKIELEFEDGRRLAMPDPRRFGRIRLRDDPRREPPVSDLGFDPLLDLPGKAEFRERIGRGTVSIKGRLLDQSFAAGVGNWIADEILYQAAVAPHRPCHCRTPRRGADHDHGASCRDRRAGGAGRTRPYPSRDADVSGAAHLRQRRAG